MCQALGIKGGTWADPRPYCPRPPWQLPNTLGHSPELTAPPTILMLAYLLRLKKSYVLLMGLINVTPKSITLRHTRFRARSYAILSAPETGIYQAWGGEKLWLAHSGSEPFILSEFNTSVGAI